MPKKSIKIAIGTEKGGVGKTTSAMEIATQLGMKGYKVLAIDTCPQYQLSKYSPSMDMVDRDSKNFMDLLKTTSPDHMLDGIVFPSVVLSDNKKKNKTDRYYDLIIGTDTVSDFEKIFPKEDDLFLLSDILEIVDEDYDYDFIIMDINPKKDKMMRMIYSAVDYVISPFGTDRGSIDGLYDIYSDIKELRDGKRKYSHAKLLGLLFTKCSANKQRMKKQMLAEIDAFVDYVDEDRDNIVVETIPERTEVEIVRNVGEWSSELFAFSCAKPSSDVSRNYSRFVDNFLTVIDRYEKGVEVK